MLRVKVTQKIQVVKPKDLLKTLDSLAACGYDVDPVATSGFWFWKKHIITFRIFTAPDFETVCRHIADATLGNRNLIEVHHFIYHHASFYRKSHLDFMRELFEDKERELTQLFLKAIPQPTF